MIVNVVPLANVRICSFCASQIDSRSHRVYVFGSGWFRQGQKTAHVQKVFDRFACEDCIFKIEHGISIGQLTIFDE